MFDQATELRKLVLQAMRENAAAAGPPPRLLVMTSGKGGVGVTTLAVNLAVALSEQGLRVVVVDSHLDRSDVAAVCGLSEQQTAADAGGARRDIHEVMQRGPAGIQIVPGLGTPGDESDWSDVAQERLLRQFRNLGRHADVLVLDSSSGQTDFLRRCCRLADDVLLVTTPDAVAVMDSYARIKAALTSDCPARLRLVVNRCNDDTEAADVQQRIEQSCRRFLGIEVSLLGRVPLDEQVPIAAARTIPFVISSPASEATRFVERLALRLARDERLDDLPAAA